MMGRAARQLEGRLATLLVADPFELVEELSGSSVAITLVSVDAFDAGADRERALAALSAPISWQGTTYEFVVLQERHGHGLTQELLLGEPVECNVIGVSARSAEQGSPWGLDSWRGGLAAIATLELAGNS
jgi:hypothetical protein